MILTELFYVTVGRRLAATSPSLQLWYNGDLPWMAEKLNIRIFLLLFHVVFFFRPIISLPLSCVRISLLLCNVSS